MVRIVSFEGMSFDAFTGKEVPTAGVYFVEYVRITK